MATPPRNDQRDRREAGAPPNNGKRWAIYVGIAVVVLLLIFFFFGGLFTDEPALDEDAAGEGAEMTTEPETTASEAETEAPEPSEPDSEAEEDEEEVIEIEGDADVEVLDDDS